MSKKTIAGIVLYNPDRIRLEQNIKAIVGQVDEVVLYNNGIKKDINISRILEKFDNVYIIGDGKNIGIAAALNKLVQYAEKHGAEWILTLDQDSVCKSNLVEKYEKYVKNENIGLITCTITDRNFNYNLDENETENEKYIDNCITSGSYTNLKAWKDIGYFDEKMFIDSVDTDFCYRLRINGWKILQISYLGLLHEVGENTSRKRLLGKDFVVFNHSAFRCYYIVRNQIYFARKHEKTLGKKKSLRLMRTSWTRIFVYLIYEKDKWNKLKAWVCGLIDGYRM